MTKGFNGKEFKAAVKLENDIDAINKMLLKTWLVAVCAADEDTFRFRVDGFPMIKFKFTKKGNLKVIENRCKDKPDFPEDSAFQFDSFAVGKIVTLKKFEKYARAWVAISNLRVQLVTIRYGQQRNSDQWMKKFTFNPHANKIQWHNGHEWQYFKLTEDGRLSLDVDETPYLDTHCGYHSITRPATKLK
jgi:hypothetical protein